MKILAYLCIALLGCAKDYQQPSPSLIISNANPIQFWAIGDEIFNEQEICSVLQVCFCQQRNCDDPITLQIYDDEQLGGTFTLLLKDVNGATLNTFYFTAIGNDHYQVTFTPSDPSPDLCDQQVRFYIHRLFETEGIGNPDFEDATHSPTMSGWDGSYTDSDIFPTATQTWAYSAAHGGGPTMNIAFGTIVNTYGLKTTIDPFPTYQLRVRGFVDASSYNVNHPVTIQYHAYTSLGVFLQQGNVYVTSADGAFDQTITINLPTMGIIALVADNNNQAIVSCQIVINHVNATKPGTDQDADIYKSDCVTLGDDDNCTLLIEYSNSTDFAGLSYASASPDPSFFIRIPVLFFDESFPDEFEALDLSDSQMVQLRSELKHKKYLDIGFLPYYMIQKIQLILAHDSIIIDGTNWIKLDAFNIVQGNKRYPLRRSNVLLTDKDFIQRNIL